VVFEPLDFLARLAALVPKPRAHLTRDHGVFAPHSRWRAAITPAGRGSRTAVTDTQTPAERHRAMSWAKRLKRVFQLAGVMVGGLFAAITFAVSAFALPMIDDRQTDAVTAVVASVNTVLRNKRAMLNWAAVIITSVLIGFATAFLLSVIMIPLLASATWHVYLETIDASAWPKAE
jgi:Putative transposase